MQWGPAGAERAVDLSGARTCFGRGVSGMNAQERTARTPSRPSCSLIKRSERSGAFHARRSALVRPRRLFFGRATRPWLRIEAATVFLLTFQPRSCSAAVIGGEPSRPPRRRNNQATAASSALRRARRSDTSPWRHL